jgi:hypothetical protein
MSFPTIPAPDYQADQITQPGLYRVVTDRPDLLEGPFPSVRDMAHATGMTDYPPDGYIIDVAADGTVSSVPALNPDDLLPAPATGTVVIIVTAYSDPDSPQVRGPFPTEAAAYEWIGEQDLRWASYRVSGMEPPTVPGPMN